MYEEDELNQNPIYRHVHKEDGLSSKNYLDLKDYYSCQKDTVVMRGMNFRTESEFNAFKKKLENGEYYPKTPESFTRDEASARAFAGSKKTFFAFADPDLFVENAYKKATEEKISGFGGVIIKTVIPAGEGLDVSMTGYGVEDEILYMTDAPIKCTYEIIDSYETELKNNPIDINEYLQNNSFEDGLFNYILANHADEINVETQHNLFDRIIEPFSKPKEKNRFMIDEHKKLLFGEERNKDYKMKDKEISFYTKPVYYYFKRDLFRDPSVVDRVKKFSRHVIEEVSEFIEMETLYSDPNKGYDVYYDTEPVKDLTYFCDADLRDRFRHAVNASRPKTYNELNDSIRELNYRDDLSPREKTKEVESITKAIVSLLEDSHRTQTSNKIVERDLEEFKERKEKAKERGRSLKNR